MRATPRVAATTLVLVLGIAAPPAVAGSATGSSPSVRPNPDQQILATPAKPTLARQPATQAAQPNPDEQTLIATHTRQGPIASRPAVIVRVSSGKNGFDWGDAGIGAAGALGLSLMALAGGLVISQHRARRTTGPADATN
jgi:hypothetical protein